MYSTEGIDLIATITELRSNTSELLEQVKENRTSVLIQKNNEAYAVLIDWETYKALLKGQGGDRRKPDKPQRRGQSKTNTEGTPAD